MALIIEDALSQMATKGFRLLQRHDQHAYETAKGATFLLSELPAALTLRVDAHSSAPIFAEQTQAKDRCSTGRGRSGRRLVELVDPPHRDALKVKARERDQARAENAKEMLKIQAAKAMKPAGRPAK